MCTSPLRLTKQDNIDVPCGKCPACKKRRVSAWSFRLMQQDKTAHSSHFVTLTYDTKYVPITPKGFMTCDKKDVQDFLKRLRKLVSKINNEPVKYYLCSEYGGKTNRPHYHMIIFNVCDEFLIEQAWQKGTVHYGKVSHASVGYTLKYMDKPKRIPMHANDDRQPEFGLMSKQLGANYLTEKQ